MNIYKVFVTGSRAYGTVHEKSDMDVVIELTFDEINKLAEIADKRFDYPEALGTSLHFGRINMICVPSKEKFEAWLAATAVLASRGLVTKEEAIDYLEAKGVSYRFPKGVSDTPKLIGL